MRIALVVAAAFAVAATLQGCGPSGNTPTPHPTPSQPTPQPTPSRPTPSPRPQPTPSPATPRPTPSPPTPAPPTPRLSQWKLDSIVVLGSHLYNSKTKERFVSVGIGLPNSGENVDDWIKVLKRVRSLSKRINTVRIYEPPTCALNSTCFEPYMRTADELGIYVAVAGTGTIWGWLPGEPGACKTDKLSGDQGCYQAGGVLGFGQKIVQNFNYPNTLAIVIGNEFEMQMLQHIGVLKAYARDLKKYMKMCDTDKSSPIQGKMRQIPLMYASSDADGDKGVQPRADYLFCGDNADAAVDIFALNSERWCEDVSGRRDYDDVNNWVSQSTYPGAFVYSEMGCAKNNLDAKMHGVRDWSQVPSFFKNYPALDGFMAYVYWSPNPNFNMFDGASSTAKELDDGKNFFKNLESLGGYDNVQPHAGNRPACAAKILGTEFEDYTKIKTYDTGPAGYAENCPKPLDDEETLDVVI